MLIRYIHHQAEVRGSPPSGVTPGAPHVTSRRAPCSGHLVHPGLAPVTELTAVPGARPAPPQRCPGGKALWAWRGRVLTLQRGSYTRYPKRVAGPSSPSPTASAQTPPSPASHHASYLDASQLSQSKGQTPIPQSPPQTSHAVQTCPVSPAITSSPR